MGAKAIDEEEGGHSLLLPDSETRILSRFTTRSLFSLPVVPVNGLGHAQNPGNVRFPA
jgi:hypothetical protein